MGWMFWRKVIKPDVAKRRLRIPAESVRAILVLYDKACEDTSRVAKYDFWQAIIRIFPEVAEGAWRVEFERAVIVDVVEQ